MKKTSPYKAILPGLLAMAAFGLTGWGLLGLHAREAPPEAATPVLVHQGDALLIPEKSPLRKSLLVAAVEEQSVAASGGASLACRPSSPQPVSPNAAMASRPSRIVLCSDVFFNLFSLWPR